MFGRKAAFGLKDLNLPEEALDNIETEEQLMATLGLEVDQVNENENNTLQKSIPENIQYVTLDD